MLIHISCRKFVSNEIIICFLLLGRAKCNKPMQRLSETTAVFNRNVPFYLIDCKKKKEEEKEKERSATGEAARWLSLFFDQFNYRRSEKKMQQQGHRWEPAKIITHSFAGSCWKKKLQEDLPTSSGIKKCQLSLTGCRRTNTNTNIDIHVSDKAKENTHMYQHSLSTALRQQTQSLEKARTCNSAPRTFELLKEERMLTITKHSPKLFDRRVR